MHRILALAIVSALTIGATAHAQEKSIIVTPDNFVRAETDMYFAKYVSQGSFGKITHERNAPFVDDQKVVRMNRDTLYSAGVFDLDAGPVTIKLPDIGKRFMSLQVLSEDQYTLEVDYAPATVTLDKAKVGTRYVFTIVRTLANPDNPSDMNAAHKAQDAVVVHQAAKGLFEIPNWDSASRDKVREALSKLSELGASPDRSFGTKEQVSPLDFTVGAAVGWGGNPVYAAKYLIVTPKLNDGKTVYKLMVKDVPVDGFWSISVYNAKGFFEKNDLNAYSLNSLTAKPNPDGSYTIQFGGCAKATLNCLPTAAGWNYAVRLYRARKELLEGRWSFPEAKPVK
ncbi:DUF1254 domain-containing protein [Luteibacter sp. dw_328]|uniref:DUF1254 domain-containing protein n=1 Tax=Luteibacter sp. dw_328 TaxID=2719796 RepID=UPI001BD3A5D5|nr:DUF1254 domain-containing protein [Luteibacter sp. dw_328]